MKFKAEIDVMPQDALLDPQGKAVSQSMKTIGLPQITDVRIGRHIQLFVEASNEEEANAKVEEACKKLLVNQVMERFDYTLEEAKLA
jgi:phosphoribosylformylglycinamidine synthase